MPPGDEYAPLGGSGGGKLKLKGDKVSDGRIEKKKKKKEQKKKAAAAESSANTTEGERETTGDNNSLARQREKEKDGSGGEGEEGNEGRKEGAGGGDGEILVGKTEAEKRYEEQRRKRLQDRLKREGVKTHKERVEELNKYLSRLTEHHDMPKIGPG